MIKKRYIFNEIKEDLNNKMVFIGGPRQVGKTTLSKSIAGETSKHVIYLNWDNPEHRKLILEGVSKYDKGIIVYDEIHKYSRWKNFIKGNYDVYKDKVKIIVTGSARLDIFRKGGDSMTGRFCYYRLHPFTLAEALNIKLNLKPFVELKFKKIDNAEQIMNNLLKFGGFPEPFLAKDLKVSQRFRRERIDSLVKDDIRDLNSVKDLSLIAVLISLIPDRVASLLSINSLKNTLEVAHATATNWMDILEKLHYVYLIRPYNKNKVRALKKMPKLYLWDWSEIEVEANKYENFIASSLLKFVHYLQDNLGYKAVLYFIQDSRSNEIDFFVEVNNKPWFLVEAKSKSKSISKNLLRFKEEMAVPFAYQVVKEPNIDFERHGIKMISADKFLTGLI